MNSSKLIHCQCKLNGTTKKFFAATLDNFFSQSAFRNFLNHNKISQPYLRPKNSLEGCGLSCSELSLLSETSPLIGQHSAVQPKGMGLVFTDK